MSPKLPILTAKKLLKLLHNQGFGETRQSGSHIILKHPDGRRVTVPVHKGRDLGRGILSQIMKDAKLTVDDIRKL